MVRAILPEAQAFKLIPNFSPGFYMLLQGKGRREHIVCRL